MKTNLDHEYKLFKENMEKYLLEMGTCMHGYNFKNQACHKHISCFNLRKEWEQKKQ